MLTYTSVVRASAEGLAGTLIGKSFLAPRHFFRFGQFVSLSTEAIFSFIFWEAASIVSLGEAKMASFLRSNFDQILASSLEPKSVFLEFVASNSMACLGSDRMRQEATGCKHVATLPVQCKSGTSEKGPDLTAMSQAHAPAVFRIGFPNARSNVVSMFKL